MRKFADTLEEINEVHVTWDGYDLDSLVDKNHFMESGIYDANFVIVIATQKYKAKADARSGGVGIETFMASASHWDGLLQNQRSNVVLIKREGDSTPRYLEGHFHLDFCDESQYQENIEDLLELVRGNSTVQRPPKRRPLGEKKLTYEFAADDEPDRVVTSKPSTGESSTQLDSRFHAGSFKPYGKQRLDLIRYFTNDWLPHGTRVAILQGFPGCGKSQLAIDVAAKSTRSLDIIEAHIGAHYSPESMLIDLGQALANEGIPDLLNEVEKGADGDPFFALLSVLRRYPVLVVIDEFQRFFAPNESHPPPDWQRLVEQLNNSTQPFGRLLLICNRATKIARWCEKCVIKELRCLDPADAAALLADLLEKMELCAKVPKARLTEICQRLGGNPRALGTLVGGLLYDSLDELLSHAPDLLEIGDITLDSNLVEEFEREVLARTLSQMEPDLLQFMRWISVHRRPFKKEAMSELPCDGMPYQALRRHLIERFLVVDTTSGDAVHPLAREICVTRLRDGKADWMRAHGWAANYHLRRFKAINMTGADRCLTSYAELRHHLFEAGRLPELYSASATFARFVLSLIPVVNQSQVPSDREVLAERIALISALPDDQRSKGLEFHLALCLKHRNIGNDYQTALAHVRHAVGPNAYYAVWLLLIELEYALNGRDAMLAVHEKALRHLGSGSNAFAVYFLCANLLGKNREYDGAIAVLEKGIAKPGIQCLASLTELCATFMEKADRFNDAILVLRKCIGTPNTPELYKVQIRCALLLERVGRADEGELLLRAGIADPHVTYLDKLYLALTELLLNAEKLDAALQLLNEGLEDTRVKDKGPVYCKAADLLMQAKLDSEAIALLTKGLSSRFVQDPVPLQHKLTALAARADGANATSAVLAAFKNAARRSDMAREPSIYLTAAKQLFQLRNVEDAIGVLKQGLKAVDRKEKAPIYQMCAELTARQGRLDEAVLLLENGFVDKCVRDGAYLYQVCAELLDKGGRLDDAPRVTIVVASLEPRTRGAAMKDICGTLRTIIQRPGSRSAVAA